MINHFQCFETGYRSRLCGFHLFTVAWFSFFKTVQWQRWNIQGLRWNLSNYFFSFRSFKRSILFLSLVQNVPFSLYRWFQTINKHKRSCKKFKFEVDRVSTWAICYDMNLTDKIFNRFSMIFLECEAIFILRKPNTKWKRSLLLMTFFFLLVCIVGNACLSDRIL